MYGGNNGGSRPNHNRRVSLLVGVAGFVGSVVLGAGVGNAMFSGISADVTVQSKLADDLTRIDVLRRAGACGAELRAMAGLYGIEQEYGPNDDYRRAAGLWVTAYTTSAALADTHDIACTTVEQSGTEPAVAIVPDFQVGALSCAKDLAAIPRADVAAQQNDLDKRSAAEKNYILDVQAALAEQYNVSCATSTNPAGMPVVLHSPLGAGQ